MSSQVPYIPYKHILLIILLSFIALWLYTPPADSLAKSSEAIELTELSSTPVIAEPVEPEKTQEVVTEPSVALAQPQPEAMVTESTPEPIEPKIEPPVVSPVVTKAPAQKPQDKVVVRQGDTLSQLFDRYGLGQTALRHIVSADESLLALETLRTGQVLYFRYQKNTQSLKEMELYKHAGHRIVYRRTSDDGFEYETFIDEGKWHSERISGTINGAFYLSAQRAGLTEIEAANVVRIFEEQLDFSRAIRKGDTFQIVRSVQRINGKATGQTRIDSARIKRRVHEHTAFLFDDGRYYCLLYTSPSPRDRG